jgi:hypothetical protein
LIADSFVKNKTSTFILNIECGYSMSYNDEIETRQNDGEIEIKEEETMVRI